MQAVKNKQHRGGQSLRFVMCAFMPSPNTSFNMPRLVALDKVRVKPGADAVEGCQAVAVLWAKQIKTTSRSVLLMNGTLQVQKKW